MFYKKVIKRYQKGLKKMKFLRNYLNNVKPSFVGEGKYSKWFTQFDDREKLYFFYIFHTFFPLVLLPTSIIQNEIMMGKTFLSQRTMNQFT